MVFDEKNFTFLEIKGVIALIFFYQCSIIKYEHTVGESSIISAVYCYYFI